MEDEWKKKYGLLFKGLLAANGFALVCMTLSLYWLESGTLILSEFVILPMAIGLINAFAWRSLKVSGGASFLYGFYNLVFILVLSAFFMKEGIICLIIVSPLLYIFIMIGILLGWFMFSRKKNKLNISIIAALASIFVVNAVTASPSNSQVTDRLVIDASPEEVWKHVVSFSPIEEESDYWLFKIGLPSPVQSVAEGDYVGANRQLKPSPYFDIWTQSTIRNVHLSVMEHIKDLSEGTI